MFSNEQLENLEVLRPTSFSVVCVSETCVTVSLCHAERFYPLSEATTAGISGVDPLDNESYRNAMIFSAVSLVTSIGTGYIIYLFVSKTQPTLYAQVADLYMRLFKLPSFVLLMIFVSVSTQILAVAVTMYHSRVWYFSDAQPPP
eukprot:m.136426 g.136426  ORF g.136426 m.136426 type:complete len:145 (+) comp16972_c1_seq2:1668-2102(+)